MPGSACPAWRLCALLVITAGCARRPLPDAREAARAYEQAAVRGDSAALYAMMSESAHRGYRQADIDRMLADERVELVERAHALAGPNSLVVASARVRFEDGEEATLDWDGDAFRVTSAGGLPSAPRTPAQALEQLRKALARRSYVALLRVLSPATRSAIESDLRALVLGLSHPEGLDVQVSGDVASVAIEGGHFVRLRLDSGVWKVEDFD
jgi:hypothetical protein